MGNIEQAGQVTYDRGQGTNVTGRYDPGVGLAQVEQEWVSKALIHYRGNIVATAKALQISRAKLYRHIQSLGAKTR